MATQRPDRAFQFSLAALFIVVTIACFALAKPMVAVRCSVSLATLALGLACVRAAWCHRASGWISGLVFGLVFVALGAAACLWSFGWLGVSPTGGG